MKESLAAQLEWWGNSSGRLAFKALGTVEASKSERAADGVLTKQFLADLDAVEAWELLGENSPYFRLVFDNSATFAVVMRQTAAPAGSA